MNIDYHDKYFTGVENYDDGDLTAETLFHYRQKGNVVWGTYEGGRVAFGTLVAQAGGDGGLDMAWQYLATDGRFVSGRCASTVEILPDGRYRLHESWTVDGDGNSGSSVIEEIQH